MIRFEISRLMALQEKVASSGEIFILFHFLRIRISPRDADIFLPRMKYSAMIYKSFLWLQNVDVMYIYFVIELTFSFNINYFLEY